MGHPRWELAGRETGKRNLPQEMGHPRWELAGRKTGRGIYHMTWDFQDEMGLPRWELAGRDGKRNFEHDMGLPLTSPARGL